MTNPIKAVWTSIPDSVTVIAVTKTFSLEAVALASAMGLHHIGENRVAEAKQKWLQSKEAQMPSLSWHMIGHVQSRKIEDVVEIFDYIDSVDSDDLVKKIDLAALKAHKHLHILLEVNIFGEETKYGFDLVDWEKNPEKLQNFLMSVRTCMGLKSLVTEGLMTMAPFVTNAEENRSLFQSMKRLSQAIRTQIPEFGTQLSMGTSCDYEVAIQEGATQVRLGEALFGPRQ
jgi:PLP dependent protein